MFPFCLGSWIGWVGRSFLGSRAGLPSCLHVSFLGCWVGWVGRGQGARRPSHKAGLYWAPSQPRLLPSLSALHVSFWGSWVGWVVHGIFIALYADKPLSTSFSRYARLSSCFSPHDSHTLRISSSFTAKSCAVCSSANLRAKSALVPCEETNTATHLAYQTLLQQNPVQYARRRVWGKNRDRFRLKKTLSCKPTHLNPNFLQQTYAAEASMLQQLQQNMSCFPCVVSVAEKNADKFRPTASAKSRYARQNSHLFPCDSQTNRMPNVLCVFHKRIQQRPRIHPSRKVTVCNGCGRNVDCFRAGGAAAPRSCVRRCSFGLRKKSTTGLCKAIFIAL